MATLSLVLGFLFVGCAAPLPAEFTCTCTNEYTFDDGSFEEEEYSDLFYCDETDAALDWVSTEVDSCEEYASVGGESYNCDCSCNDNTACQ